MQYCELRLQNLLIDSTLEQCHEIDYVFHFLEFGELKYVHMSIHHIVDSYSAFQYTFA